jgi:hypothetical protein
MKGWAILLLLLAALPAGIRMTEAGETGDAGRARYLAGGGSSEQGRLQEEKPRTAPRFVRLKSQNYPTVVHIVPFPESSAAALQADKLFLEYVRPPTRFIERLQQMPEDEIMVRRSWKPPGERVWYKAGPHPFLSSILPGADLYVVALCGDIESPLLEHCSFAAIDNGKFYMLPDQLVQLLYDNGLQFRESDIETWTHALALVWSAMKQPYLQRYPITSQIVGIYSDSMPVEFELFPGLSIVHADIPVKNYITGERGMIEVLMDGERSTLQVTLANMKLPSGETRAVRCVPRSLVEVDDEGLLIDGTFDFDHIETSGE